MRRAATKALETIQADEDTRDRSPLHIELVNLLKKLDYLGTEDRERIEQILLSEEQENLLNKLSKSETILLTNYFIVTDKVHGDRNSDSHQYEMDCLKGLGLDELD